MALPVPRFRIHQSMPLVRQRREGLGQQGEGVHADRFFARLGQKERSFHPKDVSQIQKLKNRSLFFRQGRFLDINLQPTGPVLQMEKLALTHVPMGNDAPGHPDLSSLLPVAPDLLGTFGIGKQPSKGIHAEFPQLGQLLPAHGH